MDKKAAKVAEGRNKEDRKKVRKTLGTLKSLTVQPRTKTRYQQGLNHFFGYLQQEHLALPKKRDDLDAMVADYLEYL